MSDVVRPNNHISTIMKEYVKELEFKYQNPGELCGISTGYDCLDYKLDGLKSGEVTIIGGRPAMGKTALAANLSYNIAAGFYFKHQQNPEDDKCVVYIGLELAFQLYQKCRRIKCAMMKTFEKISVKLSLHRASLKNYHFTYILPNAV